MVMKMPASSVATDSAVVFAFNGVNELHTNRNLHAKVPFNPMSTSLA